MVKYKIHEPRQIAERRDIKNYKNMSKKELLSPVDESKKKKNLSSCRNAKSFTK